MGWHIVPLVLLLGLSIEARPASDSSQLTQSHEQLLVLVPDPLPAHAAAQGSPSFYLPDSLYQYMDGGADIFLYYDFQTLLHQEFRAGKVDVTLDVFDMNTPENAFGIYAAERAPWYNFIPVGTEGYKNEGILNFLQGRYYVKVAGFGADSGSVLEQFANEVSARIGEKGSLPALVQKLPRGHLKLHSEQFLRKDPLGHAFLSPAYLATYNLENQESMLLVSVAANDGEAQQRLKLLDQHFRDSGKCEAAPELGAGAIRASNSFEGKLIARAKGRYLVVLFNPVTSAPEILREVVDHLE